MTKRHPNKLIFFSLSQLFPIFKTLPWRETRVRRPNYYNLERVTDGPLEITFLDHLIHTHTIPVMSLHLFFLETPSGPLNWLHFNCQIAWSALSLLLSFHSLVSETLANLIHCKNALILLSHGDCLCQKKQLCYNHLPCNILNIDLMKLISLVYEGILTETQVEAEPFKEQVSWLTADLFLNESLTWNFIYIEDGLCRASGTFLFFFNPKFKLQLWLGHLISSSIYNCLNIRKL